MRRIGAWLLGGGLAGTILAVLVGVFFGLGAFTVHYGEGLSYMSSDPRACVNCHIMRDNFDLWAVASHRTVTCNECHVPHGVRKYTAELRNGIVHSAVFTLRDVEAIRIKRYNQEILQANCEECHRAMVSLVQPAGAERGSYCFTCHPGVGHGF